LSEELPEGPPEDWEVKPGQLGVGHIALLTQYTEPVWVKKKHPIGFYVPKSPKKKKRRRPRA
jgi:hypothetical protein